MSTIGSLSGGPACEPAKLIIEVVGLDHPEGQRLLLAEHGSQEPVVINKQPSKEVLEDENYSSTLHIWPWDDEPSCDVWLEIDATSGAPIRLPLAENITASPRQQDGQWNQIAPVVPMTMVRSGVRTEDEGAPVLSRPGYLYVFYNGMPWRELEIRQTEEGTFYHDINLRAWRESGSPEGRRSATGIALQEVWLPARWNNHVVPNLDLAYSEVQWSAPRLRRLESDARTRHRRCQPIAMTLSKQHFETLTAGPNSRNFVGGLLATMLTQNEAGMQAAVNAERRRRSIVGRVFPLSVVEPQRQRQDLQEHQFNEPAAYLLDLEGKYPEQCMEHAEQTLNAYLNQQSLPRGELETDSITVCMERYLLSTHEGEEREYRSQQLAEIESNWLPSPVSADVLQSARERLITGVLVEDAFYRMRQLRDRMEALQDQIMMVAEIAGKQPHFTSALLVHNYIIQDRLGNKPNPLSRYSNVLDPHGRRKIHRALALPLKRHLGERHDHARSALATCLEDPYHLEALADAFSQEGLEYSCTFSLAGQMLLASASALRDPMRLMPSQRPTSADRFIVRFQQEDHPLRVMLLPKTSVESCMAPYQIPTEEERNEGNGCFRPSALAQQESGDLPDPQSLMLLEARAMVVAAESDILVTTATMGASRSVNLSLAIASNIQSALNQAQVRLHELGLKIESAKTLQHELDATRTNLGGEVNHLKISAFQLDGIEFGRAAAPQTIGEMRIERSGNVTERHLIIVPEALVDHIGLSDRAPERQMTGDVYGSDGRLVATTNAGRGGAAGFSKNKISTTGLFTLPVGHPLAQGMSEAYALLARTTAANEQAFAAAGEAASIERTTKARRLALRAMNSPLLPPFLVGVEVYNLNTAISSFDITSRQQGAGRARISRAAAIYDLTLAAHLLAERIASDSALIKRVAGNLDARLFTNPLSGNRLRFAAQVTGRMLLGAIGAILVTGMALWDAMDAFNDGDDAGWGHLLVTSGGMAMLVSVFMVGPAAKAAGLAALIGPAGWVLAVGFGLVLAGTAVVSWLKDEPMEQWLKLGPFGPEEIDGFLWLKGKKPEHLEDEHEALYRLVGLLAGIQIHIGPNPYQIDALRTQPHPDDQVHYYAMRRANKRVRITSLIPNLMNPSGESYFQVGVCMTERTRTIGHDSFKESTNPILAKRYLIDTRELSSRDNLRPGFVVLTETTPAGLDIYLEEPALPYSGAPPLVIDEPTTISFGWAVRVQLFAKGTDARHWAFPAPAPKDLLQYDPNRHNQISYSKTGQDFWADEQNQAAEQAI